MIRIRTSVVACIALLLAVAAVPPVPPSVGTASAASHSFAIEQGTRCVDVTPLRGNPNAVNFYDYRSTDNYDGPTATTYSSYMPNHLQADDTSRLFLYDGSDGVSLVVVHNRLRNGGRSTGGGSAATFRFSGLPSGGDWVVVDDTYSDQDDRFSRNRIDWTWYGERTDGGVFRGLDRDGMSVTIRPQFDEDAALYDDLNRDGNVRAWQFLTGNINAPQTVGLNMNQAVTIRTGTCGPDETPPTATLSGGDTVEGQPVTLNAGGSSDNRGIDQYRWDFDGDGEVDRTTTSPRTSFTYQSPGQYEANVTVVDGGDNTASATATISVETDDPPTAEFGTTAGELVVNETVTFDASNSSDDLGISEYRWTFGENETATGQRVSREFAEAGTYTVTLETTDARGQNATTTRTFEVLPPDEQAPDAEASANRTRVEAGAPIEFDASDSTDDRQLSEFRWEFGDGSAGTGETVAHRYTSPGTYTATATAIDGNDNSDSVNVTVEVTNRTAPEASIDLPDEVLAGTPVNATASAEDESGVVSYEWDFDGDGQFDDATGEAASYTYAAAGDAVRNATVTLRVTDAVGESATTSAQIEILPPDRTPPQVSASVDDDTIRVDESVEFEATGSDDRGSVSYEWDFGNNTTKTGETVSHSYDATGNYSVTVTATDEAGNTNTSTVEFEVKPKRSGFGGGGSGGGSVGPPPVVLDVQPQGETGAVVDVRNGRDDETVRAALPETALDDETGVRFHSLAVELADDDAHFAVETERAADLPPTPADATLGRLSAEPKYIDAKTVSEVRYVVDVQQRKLAELGVSADDLTVYGQQDGEWTELNASVEERESEVRVKVSADRFTAVTVGADLPAQVTATSLDAEQVGPDETVAVTATVENPGADSESLVVNLTSDGEVVASEAVEVSAGGTRNVSLEATLSVGSHELAIDGESIGSVTVAEQPADLRVTDLSLNSSTVIAGESVEVTATVENLGGASGSKSVALSLFGEQVATKNVSVPAGENAQVTFVQQVDAPGKYDVQVGEQTAELSVKSQEKRGGAGGTGMVPGFGIGVTLVALVIAVLLARRR